jgi:hypothetical protein
MRKAKMPKGFTKNAEKQFGTFFSILKFKEF